MKTEKKIIKKLDDMISDLKIMESTYIKVGSKWQKDAIFCQKHVIESLKWTLNILLIN